MDTLETIKLGHGVRARIVQDESAENPWDMQDGFPATFYAEGWRGRGRWLCGDVPGFENALERWPGDADTLERWLRIFHGRTLGTVDDRDGRYYLVGEGCLAWAATEIRQWFEGDVYGVIFEARVRYVREDDPTETVTEWEQVESIWGLYGDDYARQAVTEYSPF